MENIDKFDIVICIGPEDISIIKKQIEYTKKNILGYRNIYIIPFDDKFTLDGCITIKESDFPFSKSTIENILQSKIRTGWYLQQLLKFYSTFVIKDLLPNYLVLDADTFFLKPTKFIIDGKPLYNWSDEYNKEYFDHIEKLDIGIERNKYNMSGITHHMILNKTIITKIINSIENKFSKKFYTVFIERLLISTKINGVYKTLLSTSGASEYELYFNMLLKYYENKIFLRKLLFVNPSLNEKFNTVDKLLDYAVDEDILDYISIHHYNR